MLTLDARATSRIVGVARPGPTSRLFKLPAGLIGSSVIARESSGHFTAPLVNPET
jgi:hypothetical protein